MTITRNKSNNFKKMFLAKRNEIIQGNLKKITEGPVELEANDEMDLAQNITIKDLEKQLSQRNNQTLLILSKALKKIEDGTFGDCEECGEEIAESRLFAIPTCRLCINCAENEEKLKKQYRIGAR